MGALNSIVGGSEGASIPGFQKKALKNINKRGLDVSLDESGQNFGAQFQNPSFNAFNNLAQGGQQTDTTGLQNIAQGGQFNQFQNQQNPALQSAINAGLRQVNQNFTENILPGINTGSALSGTSGGSRQGIAQGLAARSANDTAADFVSKMQSDNFNNVQNRNLQATGQGVNSQLRAFQGLGQFDTSANQAQQAALAAAPETANLGLNNQFGALERFKGLVGDPTVLAGGSTNGITGGLSDVGSAVGSSGGASGLLALSDERAKENIIRVGELDNGLGVYQYNYIGSVTPVIGVIAQEVELVKPEAVKEIGGLKHVNYAIATEV